MPPLVTSLLYFYLVSLSKIIVSLVVLAVSRVVLYKMYIIFKYWIPVSADKQCFIPWLAMSHMPISLLFWSITCWVVGRWSGLYYFAFLFHLYMAEVSMFNVFMNQVGYNSLYSSFVLVWNSENLPGCIFFPSPLGDGGPFQSQIFVQENFLLSFHLSIVLSFGDTFEIALRPAN